MQPFPFLDVLLVDGCMGLSEMGVDFLLELLDLLVYDLGQLLLVMFKIIGTGLKVGIDFYCGEDE
jgi:hypothetical protein